MSNTNSEPSDIKQAADNVDAQKIERNLKDKKSNESTENKSADIEVPEDLSDEEQTPFIDDTLRTDK